MKKLLVLAIATGLLTVFALNTATASALEAQNSTSELTGAMQVEIDDGTGYQNSVAQPQQALSEAVMQADQIERSLLLQYSNDSDLIVGTYSYGSLHDLRLTRQQAEIIKNGYIPILGNPGDPNIVNKNPKTNEQYAEIDGGSGGRSITACYDPNVPRKPGENNVLVKGSMYGSSNGGYVCVDPYNIKHEACSILSEMNPCINGTFQLDNAWLLSIGVNTAEIRRQIEVMKQIETGTPPPPTSTDPTTGEDLTDPS